MSVVYIAGPFRANTQWKIEDNVRHAERVSLNLWQAGDVPVCPHTMTRNFQGECSDEVFLDGCLEMMTRCDEILLLKGWSNSAGSVKEYELAKELGMPVRRED
jgi:hypothetical protein